MAGADLRGDLDTQGGRKSWWSGVRQGDDDRRPWREGCAWSAGAQLANSMVCTACCLETSMRGSSALSRGCRTRGNPEPRSQPWAMPVSTRPALAGSVRGLPAKALNGELSRCGAALRPGPALADQPELQTSGWWDAELGDSLRGSRVEILGSEEPCSLCGQQAMQCRGVLRLGEDRAACGGADAQGRCAAVRTGMMKVRQGSAEP